MDLNKFIIVIEDTGEKFACSPERNVLKAMEQLGRKGIPVGCRGGGCGVCRVQVLGDGHYRTGKMSREQVPVQDEETGHLSGVQAVPRRRFTFESPGEMAKNLFY